MTDGTTKTVHKTLWSETLIEVLLLALKKNESDNKIIEILKELKQKRFRAGYISDKVRRSLGDTEAARVKKLMSQI